MSVVAKIHIDSNAEGKFWASWTVEHEYGEVQRPDATKFYDNERDAILEAEEQIKAWAKIPANMNMSGGELTIVIERSGAV